MRTRPSQRLWVHKPMRMLRSIMPSDQPEKSRGDDKTDPSEDKAQAGDKDRVRPAGEKIGEGAGNLRRRADWFLKRSGQKQ